MKDERKEIKFLETQDPSHNTCSSNENSSDVKLCIDPSIDVP